MRMPTWGCCYCALMLVAISAAGATNAPAGGAVRERHLALVRERFGDHVRRYGQDSNWLVRPGLLANRAARWVQLDAETVGVNDFITRQVEFALITEGSGKDYEALAVTFARPSDIHAALEFIGLHAGRPVDYTRHRYWPKGDRVRMTFRWTEGTNGAVRTVRPEDLILDARTDQPLPPQGFVFVGSRRVPDPEKPDALVYAADRYDPMAVASMYNEMDAVLDVPRRAYKSEVYELQVRNDRFPVPRAHWLCVQLEPFAPDGTPHPTDVTLHIECAPATSPAAMRDLRFTLRDTAGLVRQTTNDLTGMLAAFERLVGAGREPYVTLEPDDALPLKVLRETCAFLASIEQDKGIRIEPPLPGHPYYRAFLPNPALRDRTTRWVQPLELHLFDRVGGATGQLFRIEDTWPEGATGTVYKITPYAVPAPAAAAEYFKAQQYPPLVVIFAPGAMRYGTLRPFLQAALDARASLYVFLSEDNQ